MADEQGQGGGGGRRVLMIVLGILGAMALLGCIVCGASGAFCAHELEPRPREPARVEPSLYYGTWVGDGPTTLTVDAASIHWEQYTNGSGGHISYNGTNAGVSGQDLRVGIMVTEVTLVVADPPHQDASGTWVMTVEGVPLHRE